MFIPIVIVLSCGLSCMIGSLPTAAKKHQKMSDINTISISEQTFIPFSKYVLNHKINVFKLNLYWILLYNNWWLLANIKSSKIWCKIASAINSCRCRRNDSSTNITPGNDFIGRNNSFHNDGSIPQWYTNSCYIYDMLTLLVNKNE